jgi:cytochrome c oxidase subunit 2
MYYLGILNEMIGLPELASEHGSMVDHMLEVVHWLIAILLVGWSGFFVYCLFRFRKGKHPKADYHGVRSHASHHLEIGVVLIEAILLLGFAFPLWAQRSAEYPTGPDVVRVRAVGEQFKWTMHYPGADKKFGLTDPYLISGNNPLGIDPEDINSKDDFVFTELVLPQNRECIVTLASKDVIHNLHLPPMRIAQDAIPGAIADMWFKPTHKGRWQTICGQLCGAGHAQMVGFMEVKSGEDFDAWLKENAPAPAADSSTEGDVPPAATPDATAPVEPDAAPAEPEVSEPAP